MQRLSAASMLLLGGACALALAFQAATAAPPKTGKAPPLPGAFTKKLPQSIKDLRDIEQRVQEIVKKVMPAVVGVRIGAGQGSGVIVTEDGLVLTAAHVSGPAGRKVRIVLHNGRVVNGVTLGANRKVDAGMIKITTKGKWPYVPIGSSASLKPGDWCIAMGHPGGYKEGRTPPVRVGRILDNLETLIRTDCTLVGGDSGGPLFDMNGRVIGIHSRIGPSIIFNIHVPIDQFVKDWDVLAKGTIIPTEAWMGVQGDPSDKECRILKVHQGSPADRAGLEEGDIIVQFGKRKIQTFSDLVDAVSRTPPGTRVPLVVRRGEETLRIQMTLGRRPD